MKLIATKDIRNVASLRLQETDDKGKRVSLVNDAKHADHIHKGAVFSIGDDKLKLTAADLHKLSKTDAEAARIVSMLVHAECVADASDEKAVAAVKESIAEDERREVNARKQDQSASAQSAIAQLLTAIKGLKPT